MINILKNIKGELISKFVIIKKKYRKNIYL